jgi:hypothetical protein
MKCGDKHTDENECSIKSGDPVKCVNCKGDHPASSNSCPELLRQREIKRTMALENVSFVQAAKMVPQTKKYFSEVVASTPNFKKSTTQPKQKTATPPRHNDIDRQKINSLLSYTNGQSTSLEDGCALSMGPPTRSQEKPTSNPLPIKDFIAELLKSPTLIQLLSQIILSFLTIPNNDSVNPILSLLTPLIESVTNPTQD